MNITPEIIGSALLALIIGLAGIGNYLRTRQSNTPRPADALLTSIGIGYGDRDQVERAITQITRIAVAAEILADRRTDRIEDALERLEDQERRERDREHEEPAHTPRRRR